MVYQRRRLFWGALICMVYNINIYNMHYIVYVSVRYHNKTEEDTFAQLAMCIRTRNDTTQCDAIKFNNKY